MFLGTTPQIISQYLFREIKQENPKRIFIPFAGNFVVEQIAYMACPNAEIISTDVSIYSRAIGFGANNIDFNLKLKDSVKDDFAYLDKKCTTPVNKAAIVIFFTEVANTIRKREKIKYYDDLYRDAVTQQESYFGKIIEKLRSFQENSTFTFLGIDAVEMLKNVESGDMVFYDPPYFTGGYEKMFEALTDCLEFDEVSYTEITDDLKISILKDLHEKGCIVYFRPEDPIIPPEGFQEVFRYRYKWTKFYCVYSNRHNSLFVGSWKPLKEVVKNIRVIGKDDDITEKSKINIIPQEGAIGNHYRLMWVKKAQMVSAMFCYLVLVDQKLIGAVFLNDSVKFGSELAVIVSDPAAPTSKYKRLSKLILYLTCTKEMLKEINDRSMWEHTGFTTRVYTDNPVSMKYRGFFDLIKREEAKEGDYKFALIYQKRDGLFPTAKEGLKEWLRKHGKHIKPD